jgi:hypothetical protein
MRAVTLGFVALLAGAVATSPADAQTPRDPPGIPYWNVLSGGPLVWIGELWPDVEYERRITANATIGVRATRLTVETETEVMGVTTKKETERYTSGRAFFRYYPSGAYTHFFITLGFGLTAVKEGDDDEYRALAAGFELGHGWMLGAERKIYLSLGGGLDRLFGLDVGHGLKFIPTLRIPNIGIAF